MALEHTKVKLFWVLPERARSALKYKGSSMVGPELSGDKRSRRSK